MVIKALIVLFMLLILFNLGRGMVSLIKDNGQSQRMVKALTWRIGLSVGLFILLMIGFAVGFITPHAIM